MTLSALLTNRAFGIEARHKHAGIPGLRARRAARATGSDTSFSGSEAPSALLNNLTWEGHEFAQKIRNDTVWNKTMSIVKEKGGAVTIEILSHLLTTVMRQHFGAS